MNAGTLTLERLERWALAGGSWRVVEISAERAIVDLCACTGEPMQRLRSDDPVVIAQLRTAPSGLDRQKGG